MQNHENQNRASNANETPLVMPLTALDASMLTLVGGKAANLGELIRAGFPVPPGFCVTTTAYALLNEDTRLESILLELASTGTEATSRLGGAGSGCPLCLNARNCTSKCCKSHH